MFKGCCKSCRTVDNGDKMGLLDPLRLRNRIEEYK